MSIFKKIRIKHITNNKDFYCAGDMRCAFTECPLRKSLKTMRGYGPNAVPAKFSCTDYCPTTKSWKTLVNEINRK